MTTTQDTPNPDVVERRIRGLLAKAEDPGTTPAEAEAFSAKAFELAEKYRVDLAKVRGTGAAQIVRTQYQLVGSKYLRASLSLLCAVAEHYGVVVLIGSTGNSKYPTLVGDKDDIRMTVLMFESLRLQRDTACLASEVSTIEINLTTGTRTMNINKWRNSFCYGYARRISVRLTQIRRAAKAHTLEGFGPGDVNPYAVEVFSRKDTVVKFLEAERGKPLGSANQNRPSIDPWAAAEGDEAAKRADLGGSKVGSGGGPAALGTGR